MPFATLHQDRWSKDPSELDDDIDFLCDMIYGHLIHALSTPASFLSWKDDLPKRMSALFRNVARERPRIKPSAAIRAMLAVLRFKERHPKVVAFNDDAEVLYMIAFMEVSRQCYDIKFTDGKMMSFAGYTSTNTKMTQWRHRISWDVRKEQKDAEDVWDMVDAVYDFYLSPFVDAGECTQREESESADGEVECPTSMPLYQDIHPVVPPRRKQRMVFPDAIRKMRRTLTPIMEDPSPHVTFADTLNALHKNRRKKKVDYEVVSDLDDLLANTMCDVTLSTSSDSWTEMPNSEFAAGTKIVAPSMSTSSSASSLATSVDAGSLLSSTTNASSLDLSSTSGASSNAEVASTKAQSLYAEPDATAFSSSSTLDCGEEGDDGVTVKPSPSGLKVKWSPDSEPDKTPLAVSKPAAVESTPVKEKKRGGMRRKIAALCSRTRAK